MVLIVELHFFSELKFSMEEWLDDVYYVCNCKCLMSSLNSVSGMLIRTKLPKLNFCFVCKMQVSGEVFKS